MSKKKGQGDVLQSVTAVVLCFAVVVVLLVGGFFIMMDEEDQPILPPVTDDKKELPYEKEVYAASEKYDIEPARIYAVIQVESSFREEVISHAGAVGLMQMLPSTYEELCEKRGCPYDPEALKDPAVNIDFCCEYLRYLRDNTASWEIAHLAYNVGIGNVQRWLKNEEYSPDGRTFKKIPSSAGRTYVDRIETAYDAYNQMLKK